MGLLLVGIGFKTPGMNEEQRSEIDWRKSQFRHLSDAELIQKRDRLLPTLAEHKAAHELLVERAEEKRLEMLRTLRPLPPKPEWKTLSFWMALLGILIGLLALLRDYHGWEKAAPPAPARSDQHPASGR